MEQLVSMLKLYENDELKKSLIAGNSLFRFGRRPKLHRKAEESLYYKEMFKTIDKFNKTMDVETSKILLKQLKISLSELEPSSSGELKKVEYSRCLL